MRKAGSTGKPAKGRGARPAAARRSPPAGRGGMQTRNFTRWAAVRRATLAVGPMPRRSIAGCRALNRRKYQTRITSAAANSYAVRYRALAHVHRIDVQAKNSLNVLSTPNRSRAFRVARR
ncbi:hypothetical protein K6Y76_06990 [Burkholderia cenocepacia]|uniref:hypothetical protein n=1 Tax=Burkholderia TaxID=32008 RepID=UPI000B2900AF|nr:MULTISPECIES: hypothetical protein [Burkholderia]MDP9543156.1 hypothetical protein [Burkholderia cepacia]MBR8096136.1 hypothetical protein [Burkholderia cenocepacia]MBR8119455.1 hypothetical protein [Burkholderia cenocepacia]MBR8266633.1 hypothetical protein [Burkholderia cenocepacia]MBR8372846.1 hypothetical protein [Burkholderia cenocepacia]